MSEFVKKVDKFLENLTKYKFDDKNIVFNPWADTDELDLSTDAPNIRKNNLREYLISCDGAKYLLIAESPSYGCRFTGLAMTSEDVFKKYPNIFAKMKSTSKTGDIKEKTASIVWDVIAEKNAKFVLWNAFAFHSHKPDYKPRRPTNKELKAASTVLKEFLDLFPDAEIISVGKTAENALGLECIGLKRAYDYVRHPSCGGERLFREYMKPLVSKA